MDYGGNYRMMNFQVNWTVPVIRESQHTEPELHV
jgi:hypothetical protein